MRRSLISKGVRRVPVPLHRVDLAALMACPGASPCMEEAVAAMDAQTCRGNSGEARNVFEDLLDAVDAAGIVSAGRPSHVPGYSIAAVPGEGGLVGVFETYSGLTVGGCLGRNVFVLPEYRNFGLGSEILIAAFDAGVMHPRTMNRGNVLTVAGRANRRRAHAKAVARVASSENDES